VPILRCADGELRGADRAYDQLHQKENLEMCTRRKREEKERKREKKKKKEKKEKKEQDKRKVSSFFSFEREREGFERV